jgi:hypothetical protein
MALAHMAELLVPDHSLVKVETTSEKLKRYKSLGTDQIPAKLIKHIYSTSIWNKEELPQYWKESIIVSIYKKGGKTDCNNYPGISSTFIQHSSSKVNSICQ